MTDKQIADRTAALQRYADSRNSLSEGPITIGTRCRSAEEADAALGREVIYRGSVFRCVDHNDLGVLYWQCVDKSGRLKGKMIHDSYLDHRAGLPGRY